MGFFHFFFFFFFLGYLGDYNLAVQRRKIAFLRSKSKDKEKSPKSPSNHQSLSSRLRFWSSSDIPPSPNEPFSFSELGDI